MPREEMPKETRLFMQGANSDQISELGEFPYVPPSEERIAEMLGEQTHERAARLLREESHQDNDRAATRGRKGKKSQSSRRPINEPYNWRTDPDIN